MIAVHIGSKRRGYGRSRAQRASIGEVLQHAREAAWALLLPILILGGLRGGAFTPTEAGAVAAAYAVFVGTVVYRELLASCDLFDTLTENTCHPTPRRVGEECVEHVSGSM